MQQMKLMLRQRWIPSIFVLGFLVVIAVNAVLIVTAANSFSGLVVAHPYKKGVEYNQIHQSLVEQKALDWHYKLDSAKQAEGQRLSIQWRDSAGLALSDLSVELEASRPVENVAPIHAQMQARGGGRYDVLLDLPRAGLWDLRIAARKGEREFVVAERIKVLE